MAGGISTPRLVSEVSNAGALGSFGFAYSAPEKISADLMWAQSQTQGPVNANFFLFQPVESPDPRLAQSILELLSELNPDIHYSIPAPPFYPDLQTQLEPVWQYRPAVLSFHFGIPPLSVMEQAKTLGIAVGITATCLDEALQIERSGANFIVAQGIEAGGHRGTFKTQAEDTRLPTLHLLNQLVKRCTIPVVAAGGIMDGNDIRKALEMGAAAVQMGSAFLCCDESGASPEYKAAILADKPRATVFTKGFSGRWAQGLENRFTRYMNQNPSLPFPIQNLLTAPLRQAAIAQGDIEYQSLWAGQYFFKARPLKAQQIIEKLRAELGIKEHHLT